MSIWYWIAAEFKALGWYCVVHGPEFWLVAPIIGAAALGIAIGWICWRE